MDNDRIAELEKKIAEEKAKNEKHKEDKLKKLISEGLR